MDTTPGLYTETKPRGFPPPTCECVQPIDEYIQSLAREALSPIQLPNSKLYFKNQVSYTKAHAVVHSRVSLFLFGGHFSMA